MTRGAQRDRERERGEKNKDKYGKKDNKPNKAERHDRDAEIMRQKQVAAAAKSGA